MKPANKRDGKHQKQNSHITRHEHESESGPLKNTKIMPGRSFPWMFIQMENDLQVNLYTGTGRGVKGIIPRSFSSKSEARQ